MKFDYTKIKEVPKELQRENNISSRISMFNQNRSEIVYLSIDQLLPYKKQSRRIFQEEEINSLAQTIKEYGIRQPLTVLRKNSEPIRFEIISGERRFRAAKLINLTKIPCIIIENSDKAEEIALVENIQRQDLHPIELASALNLLVEKMGWGAQTNLRNKLGISQSTISELLKLNTLSSMVKEKLLELNYRGRDNLRKLLILKTEQEQLDYISSSFISREKKRYLVKDNLLQINLEENQLKIVKNKIISLSIDKKDQLIILLKKILSEI